MHSSPAPSTGPSEIRLRGARLNNLQDVDLDLPREAIVAVTGVSGSGKSSLAFGTLYAESQRRYLESLSPYARRLIDQSAAPELDLLEGMPPAIALQQSRGATGGARSDVGTLTGLSALLRMLYSRAGTYPEGKELILAEAFSPHTPQGACPACEGLGHVYDARAEDMVPDDSLTIRQKAVASWPQGWAGGNLRDVLTSLGVDVDVPWRELPEDTREWILFTEEHPTVDCWRGAPTLAELEAAKAAGQRHAYQGTFTGARRYLLDTFASTGSDRTRRRVAQFLTQTPCPDCQGRRLRPVALQVTVDGRDIAETSALPLSEVHGLAVRLAAGQVEAVPQSRRAVARRLGTDLQARLAPIVELGLGYLGLDRAAGTLSGGELQRLRLATQLAAELFGVVYVLDEPSSGLHPQDMSALVDLLVRLKEQGNTVVVVEHAMDVVRHADVIVDVGPGAGVHGGRILHAGPPEQLQSVADSATARYLSTDRPADPARPRREPEACLELTGVRCNTVQDLDVRLPLGCLTAVTGVSGAGKSSLVAQALPAVVDAALHDDGRTPSEGALASGVGGLRRVVSIDHTAVGRTPRSTVATYTGFFDEVRRLFARTEAATERGFGAGTFSFNTSGGRCPTCEGEGSVTVELLFLPGVRSPCTDCGGTRYRDEVLEVEWNGLSIADVLALSIEQACEVFADEPKALRPLAVLQDVGLGYLRLGHAAPDLSGGEAQRMKLAAELQRGSGGDTLYVLDEPTAGLHPADAERLMRHLQSLVDAGNTVVMAELDMRAVAQADHVVEMGPGAGPDGGRVVASGTPEQIAARGEGSTAPFLTTVLRA